VSDEDRPVPVEHFIAVVCTDRGQHARMNLGTIMVREDDSVATMTTRKAALPGSGSLGAAIGQRVVVGTDGNRDDHDGHRRWRWICGTCRRDVVLNETSLTALARAWVDSGRRVLDVSELPTA